MTNLKHTIESDGYVYEVNPLDRTVAVPPTYLDVNTLRLYLHFAQAFKKATKEWEEIEKTEGMTHLNAYLYSMVIGMDGMPVALIANVDDIEQVFEIAQLGKIEEESK
jgi:hypothetical protein